MNNHPRTAIVLVHGPFADGSSWQHVISILERAGHDVIAVQNPLTSQIEDVATTKRVIDAQKGPVVVVGHSYGGAVITGASAGNHRVKALVYVAAFAPDGGEKLGDLYESFGPSQLSNALVHDAAGFLYIDRAQFHDVFAADLLPSEARVMAATQRPMAGGIFAESVDRAAWKDTPSWFLLAREDRIIKPELQIFMSKRIGARTTEVRSSHAVLVSHPRETAKLIEEAVAATTK